MKLRISHEIDRPTHIPLNKVINEIAPLDQGKLREVGLDILASEESIQEDRRQTYNNYVNKWASYLGHNTDTPFFREKGLNPDDGLYVVKRELMSMKLSQETLKLPKHIVDKALNSKSKDMSSLFVPTLALTTALTLTSISCQNPLLDLKVPAIEAPQDPGNEEDNEQITSKSYVSRRLETEATKSLTQEQATNLEALITSNRSGHTVYNISLPVTISWNKPEKTQVKEYKLSSRKRFSDVWTYLGKTTNTSFTINEFDVTGPYELGVAVVDLEDQVSDMHASTDSIYNGEPKDAADPANGWYAIVNGSSVADVDNNKTTSTDELVTYIMDNDFLTRDNITIQERQDLMSAIDHWYSAVGTYEDWNEGEDGIHTGQSPYENPDGTDIGAPWEYN